MIVHLMSTFTDTTHPKIACHKLKWSNCKHLLHIIKICSIHACAMWISKANYKPAISDCLRWVMHAQRSLSCSANDHTMPLTTEFEHWKNTFLQHSKMYLTGYELDRLLVVTWLSHFKHFITLQMQFTSRYNINSKIIMIRLKYLKKSTLLVIAGLSTRYNACVQHI